MDLAVVWEPSPDHGVDKGLERQGVPALPETFPACPWNVSPLSWERVPAVPSREQSKVQFLKLREKSWYSPQILQEILAIAANNHTIIAKTAEEYAIYP